MWSKEKTENHSNATKVAHSPNRNQFGMTYPAIFKCFSRWECVRCVSAAPRHFMWMEIHYWFPFIDLLFIKFCAAPMLCRYVCHRNVCQLHEWKKKSISPMTLWLAVRTIFLQEQKRSSRWYTHVSHWNKNNAIGSTLLNLETGKYYRT